MLCYEYPISRISQPKSQTCSSTHTHTVSNGKNTTNSKEEGWRHQLESFLLFVFPNPPQTRRQSIFPFLLLLFGSGWGGWVAQWKWMVRTSDITYALHAVTTTTKGRVWADGLVVVLLTDGRNDETKRDQELGATLTMKIPKGQTIFLSFFSLLLCFTSEAGGLQLSSVDEEYYILSTFPNQWKANYKRRTRKTRRSHQRNGGTQRECAVPAVLSAICCAQVFEDWHHLVDCVKWIEEAEAVAAPDKD